MTIPTALPTDVEPTHHATLETIDGFSKIGLFGCNQRGERNDRAIVRSPLVRSGIKIAQGQSEHSDLLPPFTEVEQSNFVGGLGMLELQDRERYYTGENLDTSHPGKAFLGPLPQPISIGVRSLDESMWGSNQWLPLYGSAGRRYARRFQASASYTATIFATWLRKTGIPYDLTIRILADSTGTPGSTLTTITIPNTVAVPTTYGVYFKVAISQAFTSGTYYWVEFEANVSDSSVSYWEILVAGASTADWFDGALNSPLYGRVPPIRFINRTAPHNGVLTTAPYWYTSGSQYARIGNPSTPVPPAGYGFGGGSAYTASLLAIQFGSGTGYRFQIIDNRLTSVHVVANISQAQGDPGVLIAYVNDSNWIGAIWSGGNIILRKMVAGTPTDVATAAAATCPNISIRKNAIDNNYTVAISGVDKCSGVITEHSTATIVGLFQYGTAFTEYAYADFVATSNASSLRWSGSAWVISEYNVRFRLHDDPVLFKGYPFEYKGAWYLLKDFDSGATPRLYQLGHDRGVATGTQSSTTLQDTTRAWGTNAFTGAVLKIVGGTGKGQWRLIASNTATTITISGKPWKVTPTVGASGSEYVILGLIWLSEITGHGLTGPITDVMVSSKDVIYVAQGDSVNIRRMRFYNNAGAWAAQYADDGSNKATFLEEWADETAGYRIAKVNNVDASGDLSLAEANTPAWGTDMTFATAIVCGRRAESATAAVRYGDPEKIWVMKEGGFGRVLSGFFSQAPLREIESAQSENNGLVSLVHNLYLYLSFGRGGFERYYQDRLDDMGPNKDDGLPYITAGPFYSAVGYPGRFFAATGEYNMPIDKLATIFKYNGQGWHPYYTHYEFGQAISGLAIEVIPGSQPDRLWFCAGGEVVYVDLPSESLDPSVDDSVSYHWQGYMTLSWNFFDYRDAAKFFDRLKISADNLLPGIRFVVALYDCDDGSGYHGLSTVYDQSPTQDAYISASDGHRSGVVQGLRIRLNLFLNTEDRYKSPIIRSIVTKGVVFLDTKYRQDMTFKLSDEMVDLEGEEEQVKINGVTITSPTSEQKAALLEGWASAGTVLRLRTVFSPYDNHIVSIDPESLKPWMVVPDEQVEQHVGSIGFVELR